MLVLTRNLNQRIYIGDQVVVEVLGIHNGRVRLGISAPRDMPVCRLELLHPEEEQLPHPEGTETQPEPIILPAP
jgi:carbon storage regulator